jgi:hypothetical protein
MAALRTCEVIALARLGRIETVLDRYPRPVSPTPSATLQPAKCAAERFAFRERRKTFTGKDGQIYATD